ncbi:MAG: AAA family ATPase [Microcoleus sp. PH2017_29_MFU_D_A]|uniref:AAA family ATPase n=1 Tax=unclassified Microcoleus TaxID=2642155 RepID=UPI001DD44040|nr:MULTISPECIES: AAA family ATPase [unclassified Microcoleus]TAE10550.1 MAG: ATP-binding protein [Oscillatoriales cyanobacterium]MCC3586305.1 AAA family ATPase [Microcoleus sp. PH2017_30_WIL_O_A]MCC3603092.1 AAA family ATPase [Microcoleus sp. PH2017_29_MFU_D_A]MCC3636839.1 AAA family ATPase [Microcoleus sp. PH2017_37_MFU_D_B]TAE21241.1 MAG: ATP-binding protein [Oscillatoriales cyanobacterium]
MKIISLQLKNHFLGWDFDEIKFSSNLTLLVGISGAGKTQILQAILDLKRIANGKAINGLEWKIIFSTVNNTEFIWEGGFDTVETNELNFDDPEKENPDENEKPSFIYEKLISKNEVLFERNKEDIKFKNSQIPKLSSHQSMMYLLKEETVIKEAFDALNKIEYRDDTINGLRLRSSKQSLHSIKNKYQTLESIVNSDEDIRTKLYLIYENKLDIFEAIKSRFIDVFQQIEDVRVEPFKTDDLFKGFADIFVPVISIKEKSVPKWIREDRMSSGMLRTIIHLGEIFLSNEGSVILIDEFENSLGINCIDILTDDLIHENKTLQFIATSHHPYIINNIPYEYWKIVTRQGGHIRTCNASDYHLGKSKQDAFIQLNKILEKQS